MQSSRTRRDLPFNQGSICSKTLLQDVVFNFSYRRYQACWTVRASNYNEVVYLEILSLYKTADDVVKITCGNTGKSIKLFFGCWLVQIQIDTCTQQHNVRHQLSTTRQTFYFRIRIHASPIVLPYGHRTRIFWTWQLLQRFVHSAELMETSVRIQHVIQGYW